MATAANGNKIFFGGGEVGDGTWPVDSVDIYDVITNTWSVSHLSTAGHSIAAASVGNKVLFGGGDGGFTGPGRETRIDFYDVSSGNWSTALLSEMKRTGHAAVTVNEKVYFAGGETWPGNNPVPSDKIAIYDNAANTWSTSLMQEGKINFAAIASNDKIFWAGGYVVNNQIAYTSCKVEIKNLSNSNSSIQYLSTPAQWTIPAGQNAVIKDNKIVFCRPYGPERDKFDIYDITSNVWYIGILPQAIPESASIISVNNTIYIAGGILNGNVSNQVWKLEF